MDQLCSSALLVLLIATWLTHAVRSRRGEQHHVRVDIEGESALLGRNLMEALYAFIVPIARACARLGLSANAVTGCSVLLALAAGAAFAADALGLGSLFAVAALGSDAVDGYIARSTGNASDAGEVLDAAADRYVEISLFTGLAVHLRQEPFALLSALAALGGSFMVSYSTAKAEALKVTPPRGSMRRTERAFVLVAGAALTPLSAAIGLPVRWSEAPLLLALVGLALGTNGSAIARFAAIVRELRARDGQRSLGDGRPAERLSES
jgi:CDP-diacylglycerol--glycerol-3-phosphate 3-phosphatidyltransferase